MQRKIDFWTCCGRRTIPITIDIDRFTDEAWRLARCLDSTSYRSGGPGGVRVQSCLTRAERLTRRTDGFGWQEHIRQGASEAEAEAIARQVFGNDHYDEATIIDWRFRTAFHVWPDHRNGPHPDPSPDDLLKLAETWIETEGDTIRCRGGTVVATSDWNVRLLSPNEIAPWVLQCVAAGLSPTWGDHVVVPVDEQMEAQYERIDRALFGGV